MKVIGSLVGICLATQADAASLSRSSGDRSISKVINLLKEMLEKSKKDADEDRELYGKFKCYCDENEAEKKKAIEDYTKQMGLLENKIEELKGSNGGMSQDIAQLKADMVENEASRAEAEAMREKARENFKTEEADMVTAVENMQKAIDVLDALVALQTDVAPAAVNQTQPVAQKDDKKSQLRLIKLQTGVQQALSRVTIFFTPSQKRMVQDLIQSKAPEKESKYSAIVDVCKLIKQTFETSLSDIQKADQAAEEAFQTYMAEKKVAYRKMKESIEDKQADVGMGDEDLASKKEQFADLEQTRADDEEFLAKLLKMCAEKAKSYEERKLLFMNEQVAINEAISILDSEAGYDTFGKVKATSTGGTGPALLLQIRSKTSKIENGRARALLVLEAAAKKAKSLRLARAAMLLKGDNPFTLIFEEIDKVIALIETEAEEDQKNLDWCNSEREARDKDVEEKKSQIENLETEIDDIDTSINDPETGLLAQINETEVSLTQNHESQVSETRSRQEENLAYQKYAENLEEADDLLTKAMEVLKKHFESEEKEDEAASLAQMLTREDPAPPSTWDNSASASQSDAGKKVIGMLDFILKETKKEATECHSTEEEAQKAYEDSMESLKEAEAELQKSLAELQETLAEKQALLAEKKVDLKETTEDKEAIEAYLEKIKPGCDFITDNFDVREENRGIEKKALEDVKKILKDSPAYKKYEDKQTS